MLNISAAPHVRNSRPTAAIMADVAIALLPVCGMGVYLFGWRALLTLALCVTSAVLTELVYELLMKKPITIGDFSAVVTGLILGINLPSTAPWYLPVFGGIFAILVVKMLFGGLGQNFMNPALTARCFLMISYAGQMTAFVTPFEGADLVSGAGNPVDGRKIKGTIHWLSASDCIDGDIILYENLLTLEDSSKLPEGKEYTDYLNPDSAKTLHGKLEPSLKDAKPGDKFQFVRTGYFCLDTKKPNTFNRTVTLKDSFKTK